jgi:hypothetical protein
MKKRWLCIVLSIFFIFLAAINVSEVDAKSVLKRGHFTNLDNIEVASVVIYDDYSVAFDYEFMLRNPIVKVCPKDECHIVLPQVNTQQVYLSKEILTFDVSQYVDKYVSDSDVLIIASAEYKSSSNDIGFPGYLEVQHTVEQNKESKKENETLFSFLDNVKVVMNKWIIPGIYIVLALILVVKLILLCIDVIRYADVALVRKEKFKAFIYVFVGLLAVALVNSAIGIATGLYG